ncbi:uncharacterized protein LOC133778842 isoform X1 [Humulus lupulus]|uniref:uncharacterized protein LOC133778842 isoform X1 n=1 Tax=Humulus lupulus TaxID=3486 RepID=UPI002B40E5F7|nr:uncharacterized protein LOC133778842 isoform X1 [Humulus lupulus]
MENTMSVLAKTDSEVSSQTQSSPSRSPSRGRPVYYVQSPSRDSSNDGEKTTNSFNSSPVLSPMGSPPHSHSNSSLGPHSRESSSTRFSGSRKHNSSGGSNRKGSSWKPWKDQFDAIEEEGLLDDDANSRGLSRRSYFMAFIVGFLVLFSLFSLILWGASQPQRPTITMKSIVFDQFVIQAGTDHSGVATELVSMNSTVKFTFRNTATFFGVHVTSTPLDLSYSTLTVATGTIKKFYQSRKSQRSVMVTMKGSNIPLYGGGASLGSINGGPIQPVPLTLNFMVRSRAYVLGKLVKPKFYKRIQCSVVMDSKKMNSALTLKNKCTYQ